MQSSGNRTRSGERDAMYLENARVWTGCKWYTRSNQPSNDKMTVKEKMRK